jgi:uncharacterized protein (TIGR00730 family)
MKNQSVKKHIASPLTVGKTFLLSPEAEPIRKVAESLYPKFLLTKAKRGEALNPKAIPVLDTEFMSSKEGRWARILAETSYAETIMEQNKLEHTVVFFGSARIKPPGENPKNSGTEQLSHYYDECRKLAYRITRWSLKQGNAEHPQPFVITTGGGPAIMEAGNRGAKDAGGCTVGLNITLPMEQSSNPYVSDQFNFDFHYFFTRKFHFSYRAKVLVAFPGGFGTFDELFEILTLIQTNKIDRPCKILLYGTQFWQKVVNFKALVETGVISREDLNLFDFVDDVEKAYSIIKTHLKTYLPLC